MPSWDKNYNPDLIAERMEKAKSVRDDGEISFRNYNYYEDLPVLNSMLIVDNKVPEMEKKRILSQAIFITAKKSAITARSLLPSIARFERSYLAQPHQRFWLHTDLSISPHCKLPKVIFDDAQITFRSNRAKAVSQARDKVIPTAKNTLSNEMPKQS